MTYKRLATLGIVAISLFILAPSTFAQGYCVQSPIGPCSNPGASCGFFGRPRCLPESRSVRSLFL